MTETEIQKPHPPEPRLAEGMDLIGEYRGSGFKETPYLARRADGQMLQLTRLLYLVAKGVDGRRSFERIAERVSAEFGRNVSASNIQFLVEKKLRPLGVLAAADGSSPAFKRADSMLALRFRTALVPEGAVRAITTIFWPLFLPPVVITVLGAVVLLDIWLFLAHGIARSAREIVYQPTLFLLIFGMILVATAFHECGHATACRYGGAKPGVMGAGIYLVWPAFYCDVTDTYRLSKVSRLRTDLGGIYFNLVFSLMTAGAYVCTGFEPLLIVILVQHLEILRQLPPFLRLDGYYILSDLTGVPDLFARITPIIKSLMPWCEPDSRVKELKTRVRVVVTVWVLMVIPILLYFFAVLTISAPRMFATAWDSLLGHWSKVSNAFRAGRIAAVLAGLIQCVFLVLPLGGIILTFGRIGKRLGRAAWNWSGKRLVLRTGFAGATLALVGLLLSVGLPVWRPDAPYSPLGPIKSGMVANGAPALYRVPTGGSVTVGPEERPGSAPRQRRSGSRRALTSAGPDPASNLSPATRVAVGKTVPDQTVLEGSVSEENSSYTALTRDTSAGPSGGAVPDAGPPELPPDRALPSTQAPAEAPSTRPAPNQVSPQNVKRNELRPGEPVLDQRIPSERAPIEWALGGKSAARITQKQIMSKELAPGEPLPAETASGAALPDRPAPTEPVLGERITRQRALGESVRRELAAGRRVPNQVLSHHEPHLAGQGPAGPCRRGLIRGEPPLYQSPPGGSVPAPRRTLVTP